MADMIFFARLENATETQQIITVPSKNFSGRRITSGKMCKIEITQIEE